MPNWKRIAKDVSGAIDGMARESSTNGKAGNLRRSPLSLKRSGHRKQCIFWNCNTDIPSDHFMCRIHFTGLQEGKIDECAGCNRAKDKQYDLCLDCYNSRSAQRQQNGRADTKSSNKWYSKEYSPAWEKGDEAATEFFVYILKLDGGRFYVGQTRELRERISEHRDGNTKSTAGKNPKLVWFTALSSRDAATSMEAEMKKIG